MREISLILCLAVGGLWIRSAFVSDYLVLPIPHVYRVFTESGGAGFVLEKNRNRNDALGWSVRPVESHWRFGDGPDHNVLGVRWHHIFIDNCTFMLVIPYWPFVVLTAVGPLLWIEKSLRQVCFGWFRGGHGRR